MNVALANDDFTVWSVEATEVQLAVNRAGLSVICCQSMTTNAWVIHPKRSASEV